jgi:hypothetical protein
MSLCQFPADLAAWVVPLTFALDARFAALLAGLLFAKGRRTVSSWIRAARLSPDFRACYGLVYRLSRLPGRHHRHGRKTLSGCGLFPEHLQLGEQLPQPVNLGLGWAFGWGAAVEVLALVQVPLRVDPGAADQAQQHGQLRRGEWHRAVGAVVQGNHCTFLREVSQSAGRAHRWAVKPGPATMGTDNPI